jgi:hypothetical protein
MARLRIAVSSLWLFIGAAIGAWCLTTAFTTLREADYVSGPFLASLIGLAFAVLVMVGAYLAMRNRPAGAMLLKVVSGLGLMYLVVYVLFGGVDDTGWVYHIGVVLLAVLSVVTLAGLRPRAQRGS